MPLCLDRPSQRAQFRPKRGIYGTALLACATRAGLQYQHRKTHIVVYLPVTGEPMSSVNGLNRQEGMAISTLRRCVPNLTMAISLLARPPRLGQRQVPWFTSRALAVMGVIAVAVLVSMFTLDAAVIRGAAQVPRWVISVFREITEFGKSGWFLWPLGVLFLLLALPPVLTPFSQRVLAVIIVRVGFL